MKPETQTPAVTQHDLTDLQSRGALEQHAVAEIRQLREQLTTATERAERMEKDLRIAELKNASSLANNLCPDHRDKQQGKPCLACHIERMERALDMAIRALDDLSCESTYRGERTGGILKGCPRGPNPTPRELAGRVLFVTNTVRTMVGMPRLGEAITPQISKPKDGG